MGAVAAEVVKPLFYSKISEKVLTPIRKRLVSALHTLLEKAREELKVISDKTSWAYHLEPLWNDVVDAATETLDRHAGSILDGFKVSVVDGWLKGFKYFANFCVGIVTWLIKDLKGTQYAELTVKYFTTAYAGDVTGDLVEKVMKECGQSDTRAQAGLLEAMAAGGAAGGLVTGGVGAAPGAVVGGVWYAIKKLLFG